MTARSMPSYPPTLTSAQRDYLLQNLKDWSIAHGLAVRPAASWVTADQDPQTVLASAAPVTLFPSLFPRKCYEQAVAVSTAYNELYSAIATDEQWLREIVEELVSVDGYIAKLYEIHLKVKKEGIIQPIALGLFRSDYMVHVESGADTSSTTIKQVEFNTIASSFGGLSLHVAGLHKHLLQIGAYSDEAMKYIKSENLPINSSVPKLAQGLSQGHALYGPSASGLPTCVVFIVQDPERNVFDQRHLEYALRETHDIHVFRLSFDKVLDYTQVNADRKLIYRPPHRPKQDFEVSVVYFRAGYAPSEYHSQRDWDARLHIERSAAIKCPNILTHLAGSKKVQQVLATPDSPHLARFLSNSERADLVKATFAPIFPLDDSPSGSQARKIAGNPETASHYVVKPQREGGGNNIYRKDIPGFLKGLPEAQWPAYILMEMIEPPAQDNEIFRNGQLQPGSVICELGIYGVCLWKTLPDGQRQIIENFEAGHLLRTKGSDSSEGGVAAGFGCVDSPCLVDF